MAKQSPPMPVMCGSTTHSTATAVTAASVALPPARSVSTAARLASGCEVAAMPSQAMTAERPGSWKSRYMALAARLRYAMVVTVVTRERGDDTDARPSSHHSRQDARRRAREEAQAARRRGGRQPRGAAHLCRGGRQSDPAVAD